MRSSSKNPFSRLGLAGLVRLAGRLLSARGPLRAIVGDADLDDLFAPVRRDTRNEFADFLSKMDAPAQTGDDAAGVLDFLKEPPAEQKGEEELFRQVFSTPVEVAPGQLTIQEKTITQMAHGVPKQFDGFLVKPLTDEARAALHRIRTKLAMERFWTIRDDDGEQAQFVLKNRKHPERGLDYWKGWLAKQMPELVMPQLYRKEPPFYEKCKDQRLDDRAGAEFSDVLVSPKKGGRASQNFVEFECWQNNDRQVVQVSREDQERHSTMPFLSGADLGALAIRKGLRAEDLNLAISGKYVPEYAVSDGRILLAAWSPVLTSVKCFDDGAATAEEVASGRLKRTAENGNYNQCRNELAEARRRERERGARVARALVRIARMLVAGER